MIETIVLFEFAFIESLQAACVALGVRLGGYQPQYFPRLHCFARMLNCDISPVADYVQFVRKHAYPMPDGSRCSGPSYQAHTPILAKDEPLLLTVATKHAGAARPIKETELAYESAWHEKHLRCIKEHYAKAPNFETLYPGLERILSTEHGHLAGLNITTMVWGFGVILELEGDAAEWDIASIETALVRSPFRLRSIPVLSETGVEPSCREEGRDANEWLIDVCRHFGADELYYGGTAAAMYMDHPRFDAEGIRLTQQEWRCDEYPQASGTQFVPNLSIIDLLMNASPAEARRILATHE